MDHEILEMRTTQTASLAAYGSIFFFRWFLCQDAAAQILRHRAANVRHGRCIPGMLSPTASDFFLRHYQKQSFSLLRNSVWVATAQWCNKDVHGDSPKFQIVSQFHFVYVAVFVFIQIQVHLKLITFGNGWAQVIFFVELSSDVCFCWALYFQLSI